MSGTVCDCTFWNHFTSHNVCTSHNAHYASQRISHHIMLACIQYVQCQFIIHDMYRWDNTVIHQCITVHNVPMYVSIQQSKYQIKLIWEKPFTLWKHFGFRIISSLSGINHRCCNIFKQWCIVVLWYVRIRTFGMMHWYSCTLYHLISNDISLESQLLLYNVLTNIASQLFGYCQPGILLYSYVLNWIKS